MSLLVLGLVLVRNFFGKSVFVCVLVGAFVGFLSGLLGIGGGIVLVPVLVYLLGFEHKCAAGTSLLAIVFPVLSATVTYALSGEYSVVIASLLAVGSVLGVWLGVRLLRVVPVFVVNLLFLLLIVFLAVSMFVVLPHRGAVPDFSLLNAFIILCVGVLAGFVSGMLGIGGGSIVVALLIAVFGMSDLVAKGSALLMMLVSGVYGAGLNVFYRQVDVKVAVLVGVCATFFAPVGAVVASAISPMFSNCLFAVFLLIVAVKTLVSTFKGK